LTHKTFSLTLTYIIIFVINFYYSTQSHVTMSNALKVRVRFAPAPTGTMHLGNIRTALMNFLYAKQQNGTLVLRIEDTDAQRNFDPQARNIIGHLAWLGLDYDEGPLKGGPYPPYFQSERTSFYQEALEQLKQSGHIYRCFCTPEELEKKRDRQIALKMAPRYDRSCMALTAKELAQRIADNTPYVWRMRLDHNEQVTIHDIARGNVTFELKNFSDFPLTRADGSFTFIFANFVDDMLMEITHVFRGEDHLSNTANQAALYKAFGKKLPIYYHLPILCNIHGQKLSKRDFGFSINDLQADGFLPEAIGNYLMTLGGSYKEELIPFDKLAEHANFDNVQAGGQIKYDENKLKWFNHQWIQRYDAQALMQRCLPFIMQAFPTAAHPDAQKMSNLIQLVKAELHTLSQITTKLAFFFERPTLSLLDLEACVSAAHLSAITAIIQESLPLDKLDEPDKFTEKLKQHAATQNIPLKELFSLVRLALTGSVKGIGIADLVHALGIQEAEYRLKQMLDCLHNR